MNYKIFLRYIGKRIFKVLVNSVSTVRFLFNSVKKDTVLLIEANNSHTELLPSFVKYLKDLNYNINIVANTEQMGFLPKLDVNKIFYFNIPGMGTILKFKKIEKYSFIILTSYRLYYPSPDKKLPHSTIFDYFDIKNAKKYSTKKGVIYTLHHLEDYDETKKEPAIVLSKVLKKNEGLVVVNPCYFKENTIKDKNKKTVFAAVGKLEAVRKNADLLILGTKKLLNSGIKDFQINLIGDNTEDCIPDDLKDFIRIKGKMNFEKLYYELEHADFYLPLLDPIEHQRYLTLGTSGSFQLIRGFLLPPLIHKVFADAHGFNNKNSIIYNDNNSFPSALQKAIDMQNGEYLTVQKDLLSNRNEIYKNSAQNLKTLLDGFIQG